MLNQSMHQGKAVNFFDAVSVARDMLSTTVKNMYAREIGCEKSEKF
jgi:hypothetical protein